MSKEQVYTLMQCPHCEQAVRASRHAPEDCLSNMRAQRDEARAVARDLLYDPYGDTQEEREWHYETQREWLKRQADIDPMKENHVI